MTMVNRILAALAIAAAICGSVSAARAAEGPPPPRDMVFPDDTYEIFSYAAQARGSALGVQTTMDDFTSFDLHGWLNYTTAHYSHSRQFRSNIVDERAYWREVFMDCDFER